MNVLEKLASEYRSTMDCEVLHSWAKDIVAALSRPQAGEPVAEPCGGCGETNPDKRCIGCLHPFATLPVPQWPIDTDDQVEALARECGWNNRKYMTAEDYAIWCEQMRKFAVLASPQPALAVKGLNDDQIMEVIKECFPWQSEPKINDLLTHEKSPPLFPQATYDVPSYRAIKFVRAIETRIRSALSIAPDGWRTKAADDVLAERKRQVEAEGWTPEHDDTHGSGEMAGAAACYALASTPKHWGAPHAAKTFWPWASEWWKPTDPRRSLVKAGALILAEIERLDRLPAAPTATGGR